MGMTDISGARTRTSKTYSLGGNRRQVIIHGKSLHYEEVEDSGEWLDIDTAPELSDRPGYAWMVRRNRFRFDFADNYDAEWPIVASYRGEHDLFHGLKAVVHIDPDTKKVVILQLVQASSVQVETTPTRFRYNGVFAGVDVEYIVDHDCAKENIHISEAAKQALQQAIINKGLNPTGWLAFATKLDLARCDFSPDIIEDREYERRITWKDATNKARHFFPLGHATDLLDGAISTRCNVRCRLIDHPQHGWLLLSGIPLAWLKDSVGAVIIDPTDYYGEAADGRITGDNTTYLTARSTSDSCSALGTNTALGQRKYNGNYEVNRAFFSFPTSAIPDDASVTAATLYLCSGGDFSDTDFLVQIYRYAWAEALCDNQEANYDGAYGGAVLEGTLRDTADGWVADTYYNLAVATAGINKTGDSKYTGVSSRDVNADQPTGLEYVIAYLSEEAGTDKDPFLRVDYTYAVGNPRMLMKMRLGF